jgi:hypothetical protein
MVGPEVVDRELGFCNWIFEGLVLALLSMIGTMVVCCRREKVQTRAEMIN